MIWNAELYEKFEQERLQPTIDLLNRVPEKKYERILDVGCGSGMSTLPLKKRFPNAEIIGLDASAEMLEKAKTYTTQITWLQKDCGKPFPELGTFDLIFSNAFLQWLPNQEEFLSNTVERIKEHGLLALQVPNYDNMPIKRCVDQVVAPYGTRFEAINKGMCHNKTLAQYYDLLTTYYSEVTIWQTNYVHVMDSYQAIVDFISATGIRPYLECMDEKEQHKFKEQLIERLQEVYPIQIDGKVLFPFERIEFLASK